MDEISDEIKKSCSDLEEKLKEQETYWNKTIKTLASKLSDEVRTIVDLQADVITNKQIATEDIAEFTYKIYKLLPTLKLLRKQKFEYYTTSYPIKTSGTEKLKLIEADLCMYEYRMNLLENHIDFLRETTKNLENINFAIKNKVSILQILGLE